MLMLFRSHNKGYWNTSIYLENLQVFNFIHEKMWISSLISKLKSEQSFCFFGLPVIFLLFFMKIVNNANLMRVNVSSSIFTCITQLHVISCWCMLDGRAIFCFIRRYTLHTVISKCLLCISFILVLHLVSSVLPLMSAIVISQHWKYFQHNYIFCIILPARIILTSWWLL